MPYRVTAWQSGGKAANRKACVANILGYMIFLDGHRCAYRKDADSVRELLSGSGAEYCCPV